MKMKTESQIEARGRKDNRRAERVEIRNYLYLHGFSSSLRLRSTDAQMKSYAKKVAEAVVSHKRKTQTLELALS